MRKTVPSDSLLHNLQFPAQFGHIFLALKHADTHARRFGGLEGFEKFFPDELFAHAVSCILYFNDRKIIFPFSRTQT